MAPASTTVGRFVATDLDADQRMTYKLTPESVRLPAGFSVISQQVQHLDTPCLLVRLPWS